MQNAQKDKQENFHKTLKNQDVVLSSLFQGKAVNRFFGKKFKISQHLNGVL